MRTKRAVALVLLLPLLAGAARRAHAAAAEPFDFLFLDGNARAVAMGGAYTALAGDANALLYNPGGLAWVERHEATFMHNQHFQGINQEYLGFASRAGFGALLNYVDYGSLERTTVSNHAGAGSYGASDLALGGGYGRALGGDFGLGGALKFIRGTIDGTTGQGYAADFGVLYRSTQLQGLRLGAALQNLGPTVKFQRDDENLPLNLRFGGALDFQVQGRPVVFALDMTKERSEGLSAHIGAETRPIELFALRVGYDARNEAGPGVSAGFGLGKGDFGFDYAFVPFGDLGNAHRMSLTLRWGGEREPHAVVFPWGPRHRSRARESSNPKETSGSAAAQVPTVPAATKPLPPSQPAATPVVAQPAAAPAPAPAPKRSSPPLPAGGPVEISE